MLSAFCATKSLYELNGITSYAENEYKKLGLDRDIELLTKLELIYAKARAKAQKENK